MALTTITVTGHFENPDGTYPSGEVTLWLDVPANVPAEDAVILSTPVSDNIDSGGDVSLSVYASDQGNPSGNTYWVEVAITGQLPYKYRAVIPSNAAEGTIDLSEFTPVNPKPYYDLVGPKGDTGPTGPAGPAGADGAPGADGADGEDGDSAYEVAVANGFVGDVSAWLASLKGETGGTGPQGPQGPQGEQGPAGATGPAGAAGADGADGEDGASAYEVAVADGFVGDVSAWLASLKGETGATGPQGPQGPAGADGADGADGAPGADGADGADGVGVPAGGTSGQVLAKASGTDYDTEWVDQSGGGGGGVTDHGALTGLADDDHTQYALADGTRGDFAATNHNHDSDYADINHDHDSDYDPIGAAASAVSAHNSDTTGVHGIADTSDIILEGDSRLTDSRTPTAHTHDDRYYTESEVDTLLSGKSSTGHTHDHGNLTGLSDDDHPQYPLIVNTDSDAGRTIYVGATDPTGSYSPVAGDVWLEPMS